MPSEVSAPLTIGLVFALRLRVTEDVLWIYYEVALHSKEGATGGTNMKRGERNIASRTWNLVPCNEYKEHQPSLFWTRLLDYLIFSLTAY